MVTTKKKVAKASKTGAKAVKKAPAKKVASKTVKKVPAKKKSSKTTSSKKPNSGEKVKETKATTKKVTKKKVIEEVEEPVMETAEEFESRGPIKGKHIHLINSSKVVDVISNLIGPEIIDLVIELITQDEYSEFKLAEKLDMDVNAARNLLYRLLEYNLVNFVRRKDKRKGWYIYYWTFDPNDLDKHALAIKRERLELLKKKLDREFNHDIFFLCEHMCEKYDFDSATEHDFRCQECGELLMQQDNSQGKATIEEEISILEQEIQEMET